MVTTTADLTVIHRFDGILISYETGRKNAFEGFFDASAETVFDPSRKDFIPLSVRAVALAYVFMNDDDAFRVYLVPEYRPDASQAVEALIYDVSEQSEMPLFDGRWN